MNSEAVTRPNLRIECRSRHAPGGSDIYFCAHPTAPGDAAANAAAAWSALAEVLDDHGAALLQERVFVAPSAEPAARAACSRALRRRDDGVGPTWLNVDAGDTGGFAGLIAHAVSGDSRVETLRCGGRPAGRRWTLGGYVCVIGAGLEQRADDPATAARGVFAAADELLAAAGVGWANVTRTWFWLRDILGWYGDFNRVRNEFFRARGLLREDGAHQLPASTGVGAAPAGGAPLAMDFLAENGPAAVVRRLRSPRQNAASAYGSAFSRAVESATPYGRRVYVSGTASIGADGRTLHADDARAQIAETLRCVRAVLAEAGAAENDVAQALVYCRTPEVERLFRAEFAETPFHGPVLRADICRDDLLFEVECVAIVP